MVITTSKDVTLSKVSVKYSEENSVFRRVSYYLCRREWGGGGRLFEAGRLFEVGANSRLGVNIRINTVYVLFFVKSAYTCTSRLRTS